MRKLIRPQPAPAGLENYDHNIHDWSNRRPSKACRNEIWSKFGIMQGMFCAFCERSTKRETGHIEHFYHKGQKSDGTRPYKDLTFTWNNLFGCCGVSSSNTCGHYKDRQGEQGPGAYDPRDLIKPDVDDPASFLTYLDTGVIEAKQGLSEKNKKRADETIRVLNLSALNGVRRRQIDIFKTELKALEELSEALDEQQLEQELNEIINRVRQQEYQTAVLEALF